MLPEGPHSVLAANLPANANGSFCGLSLAMPTTIEGQNGAQIKQSTTIAVTGCKPAIDVVKKQRSGGKVLLTLRSTRRGDAHVAGSGVKKTRLTMAVGEHQVQVALTSAGRQRKKIKLKIVLKSGKSHLEQDGVEKLSREKQTPKPNQAKERHCDSYNDKTRGFSRSSRLSRHWGWPRRRWRSDITRRGLRSVRGLPVEQSQRDSSVSSRSTTSGEFTVGKKTVPINKTITLQGGTIENEETGALTFVGAENGETLSKTALYVPGGLFGTKPPESWPQEAKERFEEMINKGLTGVTETTELAKPASDIGISTNNLLAEEGVALSLPVKVKLSNVFLGSSCYVGSESNPIVLNLTTGTTSPPEPNKPIKGSRGEIEFKDEFNIVVLSGGSLVDNSFSAPEATGCGGVFSKLVDPIVDSQFGVPVSGGTQHRDPHRQARRGSSSSSQSKRITSTEHTSLGIGCPPQDGGHPALSG